MSKIKAIKLAFEYAKECIKYYFNFKKINMEISRMWIYLATKLQQAVS